MSLFGVFGVDIKPGAKPFKNIRLIYRKTSRCVSKTSFDLVFLLQSSQVRQKPHFCYLSFL